ncbi:MAG: hypothetical protein HUU06_03415, partial [Planctomycetaceae bacterium]|nr:hypothetical protein [Planctomycetaceae bacterium]
MAKLKVLKAFTWAHEGIHVKTHEPGEVLDRAEPALIKAAPRLGWAVLLPDAPPSPRP